MKDQEKGGCSKLFSTGDRLCVPTARSWDLGNCDICQRGGDVASPTTGTTGTASQTEIEKAAATEPGVPGAKRGSRGVETGARS